MGRNDHPTDTGMLGSDAQDPGPGRDTRQTELDPAETSSEDPTRTVGMSGADPQRLTRFLAIGMLINVIASMQLPDSGLAWADRLLEGCMGQQFE